MPDFTKPWCFTILATEFDEGKGFVPCAVFQDESGYHPMRGSQDGQQPWYWGMTMDEAKSVCEKVNAERGVSPEQARDIVMSSMFPTSRRAVK